MFQLEMDREFNVSVEKLFEAWVDVALIQQWFAPGTMTVPEAQAQVEEGGRYRIVMQNADGEQFIVGGEYKEIVANKRLAFTWQWEHGTECSLVEVEFQAVSDSASRLSLKHSEFAEQDNCDKHREGWEGCLDNLPKAL